MATILSKISTKSVGVDLSNAKEEVLDLFLIYGITTGVEKVETAYGDSDKFTGQFEAVNKATGEVFVSGQLYLPTAVSKLLVGQLNGAAKGQENVGVQFSFSIGTKPSKSQIGYEYTVKEEVASDGVDNLSQLRAASRKAIK